MSIIDDIKAKYGDFEILDGGATRTFSRRPKVGTPMKVLDVFLGGGIPLGCIVDFFGPPGSAKSSYAYECMANFQRQYPNGLVVIVDSETSVDELRMKALNVNPASILVLRGSTMESGYRQILGVLSMVANAKKKADKVPVFILWDSLSNTATDAQSDRENVNGGGLAEAARINKEFLKQVSRYLDEVDAIVGLINQVSSKIGMFVGSGWNEAGGNALKHAVQYRLEFGKTKSNFEDGIAVSTDGSVAITKNKIGPCTKEFPLYIDNTKGGVIDPVRSLVYHINPMLFDKPPRKKGYHYFPHIWTTYPKYHQFLTHKYPKMISNFTWDPFIETMIKDYEEGGIFFDFWMLYWADRISGKYSLQKEVIASFRQEIITKIDKYIKDNGWEEDYKLPDDLSSPSSNADEDEEDES